MWELKDLGVNPSDLTERRLFRRAGLLRVVGVGVFQCSHLKFPSVCKLPLEKPGGGTAVFLGGHWEAVRDGLRSNVLMKCLHCPVLSKVPV